MREIAANRAILSFSVFITEQCDEMTKRNPNILSVGIPGNPLVRHMRAAFRRVRALQRNNAEEEHGGKPIGVDLCR
jgi:hypothetical protein